MRSVSITVIIHSFNEEKNIISCIASAKLLTDQIHVIDLESKDKTVDLAKKNGAKVFSFPNSPYVEPSREFGIKTAKTDWVLILDADERITKELAEEIILIVNGQFSYFKIPRQNIFAGIRWLKHGGWWPDHQIRLINTKYFKSWSKDIHSTPVIDGQAALLNEPLFHYFHGNFEEMVNKTIVFEYIESDLLLKAGKSTATLTFFRKFLGELYRRLFKHLGFLDGEVGIIESIYQAFSKTITYIYLYEKKLKSSSLRPIF